MFRRLGLVLCLLIATGAGAILLLEPQIPVPIPEGEANAQIAARLPQQIDRPPAEILVTGLTLDFQASNAVRVLAEAEISGYGVSARTETGASGGLIYRDGAFYLSDPVIETVTLTPGESEPETPVGALTGALLGAVERGLGAAGGAEALSQLLDAAGPEIRAAMRDALAHLLEKTPLYTLSGQGMVQDIAALALQEIRFTETEAIAVIDPARAFRAYLIGLGIGFAILAALLAMGRRRD